MKDYEISSIKQVKFDKDDIYIQVVWSDTKHKYKPRNTPGVKRIQRINTDKPRKVYKWKVTWNDSWIELTQLTTSGKKWGKFYKNIVWKALSNKRYNITDNAFVLKCDK